MSHPAHAGYVEAFRARGAHWPSFVSSRTRGLRCDCGHALCPGGPWPLRSRSARYGRWCLLSPTVACAAAGAVKALRPNLGDDDAFQEAAEAIQWGSVIDRGCPGGDAGILRMDVPPGTVQGRQGKEGYEQDRRLAGNREGLTGQGRVKSLRTRPPARRQPQRPYRAGSGKRSEPRPQDSREQATVGGRRVNGGAIRAVIL